MLFIQFVQIRQFSYNTVFVSDIANLSFILKVNRKVRLGLIVLQSWFLNYNLTVLLSFVFLINWISNFVIFIIVGNTAMYVLLINYLSKPFMRSEELLSLSNSKSNGISHMESSRFRRFYDIKKIKMRFC